MALDAAGICLMDEYPTIKGGRYIIYAPSR